MTQKQKAVVVPFNVVNGEMSSSMLNDYLSSGWTVNQIAESCIGPILVILDAPKEEQA